MTTETNEPPTRGEILGNQIRAEANKLTAEERAALPPLSALIGAEPPSMEAVEAAMLYLTLPQLTPEWYAAVDALFTHAPWKTHHPSYQHAGKILAAEVQRLRAWQHQAKEEMEMHGGDMVFACLNDL